jgi:hypothetical protein
MLTYADVCWRRLAVRGSRVGSGDLSAAARARHQGARRCLSEVGQERGRRCACVEVGRECALLALLVQKYVLYWGRSVGGAALASTWGVSVLYLLYFTSTKVPALLGQERGRRCACVDVRGCACALLALLVQKYLLY